MKRFVLVLALAALAVPGVGRTETTFTAPFDAGAQGGDQYNRIAADPATGAMEIFRHSANAPFSGGLGCGGQGGFAYFAKSYDATEPVNTVTVAYTDAIVGPYAFVNVAVRQGENFVDGEIRRGITTEPGSVVVALREPVTGPVTVWFGLQVSSACPPAPPIEYARLTFASISFA